MPSLFTEEAPSAKWPMDASPLHKEDTLGQTVEALGRSTHNNIGSESSTDDELVSQEDAADLFKVCRIYTFILFHGSLLHILVNMMVLVPLGFEMERIMGFVFFG
ncbi:hypothetical protein FNV43_RR08149 [Rhamnella rubrinervis]|uniref:Peptidase S54 rhomboid domain-containing protein n=1 Tax=Rhamnella rubrinervis TaxID=2594499 RepID=A0A8K0HI16_9ROSA|nr:hypothetical protein FNV43_RR08149 [Rhamnella rubrinervis]